MLKLALLAILLPIYAAAVVVAALTYQGGGNFSSVRWKLIPLRALPYLIAIGSAALLAKPGDDWEMIIGEAGLYVVLTFAITWGIRLQQRR